MKLSQQFFFCQHEINVATYVLILVDSLSNFFLISHILTQIYKAIDKDGYQEIIAFAWKAKRFVIAFLLFVFAWKAKPFVIASLLLFSTTFPE